MRSRPGTALICFGILCSAFFAFCWIGSLWFFACARVSDGPGHWNLDLGSGAIGVAYHYWRVSAMQLRGMPSMWTWFPGTTPDWTWLPAFTSDPDREFVFPLWPLFLACAVPTALLVARRRRADRLFRATRCSKCGYPKAGLPLDAPCPECGAAPHRRCPHCSYPLSGLPPNAPCPECGTTAIG